MSWDLAQSMEDLANCERNDAPPMGDLRFMYDMLPGLERTCPAGARWELGAAG